MKGGLFMNNNKLSEDHKFLLPLMKRPDLEPDEKYVLELKTTLKMNAPTLNRSNFNYKWILASAVALFIFSLVSFSLFINSQKHISDNNPNDKSGLINIETMEVNEIKGLVKIGQTKKEVIQKFGNSFITIENPNGSIEWRFDIGTDEGYHFRPESNHEGKADVDGIVFGNVKAQLFILWDKEKVNYVSMFYKGDDNKIHIYELTSDGDWSDLTE